MSDYAGFYLVACFTVGVLVGLLVGKDQRK